MSDQVKISIIAQDKATPIIEKTSGAIKGLSQNVQKSMAPWTELNSLMGVSRQVIQGIGQAYDATIGKTVEYASQVRELSYLTGVSAEDASRAIQVADDMKLGYEELTRAMQYASRQGYDVTSKGMQNLSDKYLSLNEGQERANFLMDVFGVRVGSKLAEYMNKGGDALSKLNDEVAENLVLTGKDEQAARQFEIALDNLNDAMEGVKISLGTSLIPLATSFFDIIIAGTSSEGPVEWFNDVGEAAHDFFATLYGGAVSGEVALKRIDASASQFAGSYGEKLLGLESSADKAAEGIDGVTYSITKLGKAEIGREVISNLNKGLEEGTISQEEYDQGFENIAKSMLDMSENEIFASQAQARLTAQWRDGKLTAGQYATASQLLGTHVEQTGEKGDLAAGYMEDLAWSILEDKWAAEDAYPWMKDVSDLLANRSVIWRLQVLMSGGGDVPEDWYSDWETLPEDWNPGTCFTGDTLVKVAFRGGHSDKTAMPLQGYARIMDIKVGDRVICYQEKKDIFRTRPVKGIKKSVRDDLLEIKPLSDDPDEDMSEEAGIRCSPNHRFYTQFGWVEAAHLQPGYHEIRSLSGGEKGWLRIGSIEPVHGRYEVYNLSVVEFPTYVVGAPRGLNNKHQPVQDMVVHNVKLGAANGADFMVPPGYPNDSYPLMVESGEHVKVTPAGESGGGSQPIVINNYGNIRSEADLTTLAVQVVERIRSGR